MGLQLGKILKQRRISRGYTLRYVAEKAGISATEIYRIESGARINSSVPILQRLGGVLGMPADEILCLAGYSSDNISDPPIKRLYPELRTEKQQQTVDKIVELIICSGELLDADYDALLSQVKMLLEYVKKRGDDENGMAAAVS